MSAKKLLRGVTLIEVLAAILLLGVVTGIVFAMLSSSLPHVAASQNEIQARELARDLLDEVMSKP
jgi:prepilin-type N-terminal cleavage/methylation domain-containing protein